MDTNKIGVVRLLDNDELKYCDDYVVALLDEVVLSFLDNNDKDYSGV